MAADQPLPMLDGDVATKDLPTGVADEEEEDSLTMDEVINAEATLLEEANAVLGDADDNSCSYSLGYKRQALYSCLTCTPKGSAPAGLCLGCSLHCHANHTLIELYTKRHFRCDCGNAKFPSQFSCSLDSSKEETNPENKYNHNFIGEYCVCKRPYPDPQAKEPEVMIQCCVCEDWLHEEHVQDTEIQPGNTDEKAAVPDADLYDEFVCSSCSTECAFLYVYAAISSSSSSVKSTSVLEGEHGARCILKQLQSVTAASDISRTGPLFWKSGWRSELCKCPTCQTLYREKEVLFLLEEDDSLVEYEKKGKTSTEESVLEVGNQAFARSLPHGVQVEMALGYRDMSDKLKSFLTDFARTGKVVTKTDIDAFFEGLKEVKRQKVN